jgi:hypothetical protein
MMEEQLAIVFMRCADFVVCFFWQICYPQLLNKYLQYCEGVTELLLVKVTTITVMHACKQASKQMRNGLFRFSGHTESVICSDD